MFQIDHMSAIKSNFSKPLIPSLFPHAPPTLSLHLRLPLHQPHRLLQHHKIPLQHLRPILHIPKLPHPLQRLINLSLQFPALASEPFARFVELRLLRIDDSGIAVEVCGAGLQLGRVGLAGGVEGGEDGSAGFGLGFCGRLGLGWGRR